MNHEQIMTAYEKIIDQLFALASPLRIGNPVVVATLEQLRQETENLKKEKLNHNKNAVC
jgi:hypothetical protein